MTLGGVPLAALVDTGAALSLISETEALALPASDLVPTTATLQAANSAPLHVTGIAHLSLHLGANTTITWPFHVIKSLSHHVILGVDILTALHATIDLARRQLRLPDEPTPLQLRPRGEVIASLAPARDQVTAASADADDEPILDWPDPRQADTTQQQERLQQLAADASALPPDGRAALRTLLLQHADAFALKPKQPDATKAVVHNIHTGDAAPIRLPCRRLSPHQQADLRNEVAAMVAAGIVTPSTSPWAAPVVLAKKPDGGIRVCFDYRALNAATRKDAHPLPRIDDLLSRLHGCSVFSKIDLAAGYWQVPVAPDDQPKTAFITPFGLFQCNRMPFGLCNAPATFQRLMQDVLGPMLYTFATVYLDDILIYSRSATEHLRHVDAVLSRLRTYGLHARDTKCAFGVPSIHFLGHTVSADGVRPSSTNVAAVRDMPTPTDVRTVRRFLGMAGHYRRFVPDFAAIAEPLHAMTRGDHASFAWTPACTDAFVKLKTALTTAPVLAHPDFSRPFELHTDASNVALGAVLVQRDASGHDHPTEYASRTLTTAERNYSATERECLAVVWAVRHFRTYISGQPFTVYTDHNALVWLMQQKEPEGRLARWALALQVHDISIVYRPGKTNHSADCLSRLIGASDTIAIPGSAAPVTADPPATATPPPDDPIQPLLDAQHADPVCQEYLALLTTNTLPTDRQRANALRHIRPFLRRLPSGLLVYELAPGNPRVVVPKAHQPRVLHDAHDVPTAGHLGFDKTWPYVRQRFFWENMRRDVHAWVNSCPTCQRRNSPRTATMGHLHPIAVHGPWEVMAMDVLGPLPTTTTGNTYVLVVMDLFTRWVEAYPLPTQDASTIARTLTNETFCRYGCPLRLLSDNGPAFTSGLLKEVTQLFRVQRSFTTPYHPQADGMCERFMSTLCNMLAKFCKDTQHDWDIYLPQVLFAYRARIQQTTNASPYFLLFGREPNGPADPPLLSEHPAAVHDYPGRLAEALARAHTLSAEATERTQQRSAARHNDRHPPSTLQVGDQVLLKNQASKRGTSPKLALAWSGPYKITKLTQDGLAATLCTESGHTLKRKAHVSRLKPFVPRPAHLAPGPANDTNDDPDPDLSPDQEPDPDPDPDDDDDPYYLVEAILAHRRRGRGTQYLVHWQGYPPEEATWEPSRNIPQALLDAYHTSTRTPTDALAAEVDRI